MNKILPKKISLAFSNYRNLPFRDVALFVVFFLILNLSVIASWIKLLDIQSTENRILAPAPTIQPLRKILTFPEAYNQYFNDHFPLRFRMISAWYSLRLILTRETIFPFLVVGKDGWMFYTDQMNMDYYQRVYPFSNLQLEVIQKNLDQVNDRLNTQGIKFLVVVAPNKEDIYPEYIPRFIPQIGKESRLDQVMNYIALHGHTTVIDLRQPLLEAKKDQQVYLKTDTHWNNYGAYIAYRAIAGELHKEFPNIKPREPEEFDLTLFPYEGDLTRFLAGAAEMSINPVPKFPMVAQFVPSDIQDVAITVTPDKTLPRAVVFHDSFFIQIRTYLAEHFSRGAYKMVDVLDYNLIALEKPNLVIWEVVERYLPSLENPPQN